MTTLITLQTTDGQIRNCDATCYNAKTKQCRCICGGRNHGIGRKAAIQSTKALHQFTPTVPKDCDLTGAILINHAAKLPIPVRQTLLFPFHPPPPDDAP